MPSVSLQRTKRASHGAACSSARRPCAAHEKGKRCGLLWKRVIHELIEEAVVVA